MNRYLFICYICISALGSLPTLNATSILNYLLINKTNTHVKIASHEVTLEKNAIFLLKNAGYLKELVVETEDDAVRFYFKPPLENNCRIELYKNNKDDAKLDVLVFKQRQPLDE